MRKELEIDVKPLIRKLEAAIRKLTEGRIMSRYRRVFKGKGLEFEDFRVYKEDDDSGRIDWKASMRSSKLLIREYKEERDLDIYFLVDVSSSMVFGSTKKLKNEYAAELVAVLSYFILNSRDNVGLFMFNGEVVKKIFPANKRDQYYLILKNLVDAKLYGGGCNLTNAIELITNSTKKKSVVIIVSDFLGLKDDSWIESIKIASVKFDLIGFMIRDPRDEKLPRNVGKVIISDPFSNKEVLIDPDEIGDEYESYTKQQRENVKKIFTRFGADLIEMHTDEDFIKPLLMFLKGRERKFV